MEIIRINVVYIPKKYYLLDRLTEDIKHVFYENLKRLYTDYLQNNIVFNYSDPVVCAHIAWKQLIETGFFDEGDFGGYDKDNEFYLCPIYTGFLKLFKELELLIMGTWSRHGKANVILNVASKTFSKIYALNRLNTLK